MPIHRWRHGLLVGLAAAAAQGCPDRFVDHCSCDLECPAGLAEGIFGVSGWAPIDAYFQAVLELGPVAAEASAGIDAELRAIAASLAVAVDDPEALAAALADRVAGVADGLQVRPSRTVCDALTITTAAAAAQCDDDDEPTIVVCSGECTVDAGTTCPQVSLARCVGAAPQCDGTCVGECELAVASACAGTCRGECSGTCSVRDASGRCAGRCDGGTCLGTCELAGAACAGVCTGTCESEPQGGTCGAEQQLHCQTQVGASAACEGACDGEVIVPTALPGCAAAIRAQAAMRTPCRPPALDITWQWRPAADAAQQASFKAWLADHQRHHAVLLARLAEATRILQAAAELKAAAANIDASIDGALDDASLIFIVGLGCARDELPKVADIVDHEMSALQAAVSRATVVSAALGGGA